MSRFDSVNFMTLTNDGGDNDLFSAKFKNLRFNVPIERTITLTAADECNLPGLAEKYLGAIEFWDMLLWFNGLYDAINDVKAGMKFNIPSRRELITYLETEDDKATNVTL